MSVVVPVPVPEPEIEGDTPAEVEVEPEQTDSTEFESNPTERTGLLDSVEDSGTNYNSDGETQVEGEGEERAEERTEEGGREGQRRRPRRRSEEGEGEGGQEDTSCGLAYCFKKCLNLLPSVGDDDEEGDSSEAEAALRHGAKQVVQLIVPVTICMAVVVIFELSVALQQPPSNVYFIYTPFNEDNANGGGQTFLFALLNAIIVLAIVVVMTVVLVCLFYHRCYRAIQVWLLLASGSLLFIFSTLYFVEILSVHNVAVDYFSFVFWLWNFGVVGLVVIHWKGPLRIQQAYLIIVSALVATRFLKYLPDWTTWLLLAAISIYDLVAVLCPKGPLRVLVETARERNEPIFPSLIYSSTMVWIVGMADVDNRSRTSGGARGNLPQGRPQRRSESQEEEEEKEDSGASDSDEDTDRRAAIRNMGRSQENPDQRRSPDRAGRRSQQQVEMREGGEGVEEEPRGFKLGLGDFIFYSILVGKAAHDSNGDWVIISSCFVAILIGLCLTSLILGMVRRALPALPISIFFGLMFYFSSRYLISPFVSVLNTTQVFI